MNDIKQPFRIMEGMTSSVDFQVYKMPYSNCLYGIYFINNKWRVQEVYIENETIYTKYAYAFKDYDSITNALDHIIYNNKIDYEHYNYNFKDIKEVSA